MINDIRMTIMPEDMYVRQNLRSRDIKEGDIVSAIVSEYNFDEGKVHCKISSHLNRAFISLENFMFPEISSDFDREHIPPTIEKHIGKQVVAAVVSKGTKGDFELDRKVVMKNTIDHLADNVGRIVTATISCFRPHEAFIDIGNGVVSRLNRIECSRSNDVNFEEMFSVGDQILVKLMSFDSNTKRFEVSRKSAYERIIFPYGSTQCVRVCGAVPGGAFVEYDPGNVGIMDLPDTMKAVEIYGKRVMCYIRKNTEKGFKSNFIGILD